MIGKTVEGVAPVTGVVLIVAIIVVGAAGAAVIVMGMGLPEDPLVVSLEIEASAGKENVLIKHRGGDAIPKAFSPPQYGGVQDGGHDSGGCWISPTGHEDLGNQWVSESNAYDGGLSTYASNQYGGSGWGEFIVLTLDGAKYCDKVRVNADYGPPAVDSVDIDVYKSGGDWEDVYKGEIKNCEWDVHSFAPKDVTKARFRFHYSTSGYYYWLYEFQFFETAEEIELPMCETLEASSVEECTAILHGELVDDGGELCQYRFQYGKTDEYGENTDWRGNKADGDPLNRAISGLESGSVYHFRAQVRNSAGVENGTDKVFYTEPVRGGGYRQPDIVPVGTGHKVLTHGMTIIQRPLETTMILERISGVGGSTLTALPLSATRSDFTPERVLRSMKLMSMFILTMVIG